MTAAVLSAAFLKAPARPGLVNSSVSGAASPPGGGTIDTARGRDGDDGDDGEDGDDGDEEKKTLPSDLIAALAQEFVTMDFATPSSFV